MSRHQEDQEDLCAWFYERFAKKEDAEDKFAEEEDPVKDQVDVEGLEELFPDQKKKKEVVVSEEEDMFAESDW